MKRIVSLLLAVILILPSFSFAATKQDVINAINASYQVGDTNFRLPQKYINKGVNYLNSHPLTSEQYSKILNCISAAVAYAREIGHVRYKEYTKEQINQGLKIIYAACAAAEVNLNEEIKKKDEDTSSTSSVNITTNGKAGQSDLHKTDNSVTNDNNSTGNVGSQGTSNILNSGDTSGELSAYETQSGEGIDDLVDIDALADKFVYTEDDLDKEINQKIFIIYFIAFTVLILIILLIRLIFKKKWNKILKVTLIVLFVIIALVIIGGICISLYYIEELKIIYKLYYLLY